MSQRLQGKNLEKLVQNSVMNEELVQNSVMNEELVQNRVMNQELVQNSVMNEELVQNRVMNEELVQNGVMNEELVQNSVMNEELVQNGVMTEKSVKIFVMNAKIDPKVVMDLSIFKLGGQPINQTLLEEFIDDNELWLLIGIPSRHPFLVTRYLERHSASSDQHMKKLMLLREGLCVVMQCHI